MARKAYPRRYAQAIFEIALEKQELDKWQDDLDLLAGAVADASVQAVLASPKVKLNEKIKLLASALDKVNPLARNLAGLLLSRDGVGMLGAVAGEYRRLLDEHRGIAPAEVITAVPLDEGEAKRLADRLSALAGKQVVLETAVDDAIIGGVIARIGGKLLDGSTRSKLEALRRELVGTGRKH